VEPIAVPPDPDAADSVAIVFLLVEAVVDGRLPECTSTT
jgi:hypothetical protein